MKRAAAALVVLSGGQDSTTCLAWAKTRFEGSVHAVSFDYGQRHILEIEAARKVSKILGADSFRVLPLNSLPRGSSPLTNPELVLEHYTDFSSMDSIIGDRVELTYVPHRNMSMLLVSACYGYSLGAFNLVTGVCEADNANYPDCRGEFVHLMKATLNCSIGSPDKYQIFAPLLNMSKAESIRLAQSLPNAMEALAYSHTCYEGQFPPCGRCHSCVLRAEGFSQAGIADPLLERVREQGKG